MVSLRRQTYSTPQDHPGIGNHLCLRREHPILFVFAQIIDCQNQTHFVSDFLLPKTEIMHYDTFASKGISVYFVSALLLVYGLYRMLSCLHASRPFCDVLCFVMRVPVSARTCRVR